MAAVRISSRTRPSSRACNEFPLRLIPARGNRDRPVGPQERVDTSRPPARDALNWHESAWAIRLQSSNDERGRSSTGPGTPS